MITKAGKGKGLVAWIINFIRAWKDDRSVDAWRAGKGSLRPSIYKPWGNSTYRYWAQEHARRCKPWWEV